MVDFNPAELLQLLRILSFKRELKLSEWRSRHELLDAQNKKLRSLIAYAAEHVPFYRRYFHESGISPEEIQTQEDLEHLPIVTKQMIRANPEDFLSDLHKTYGSRQVSTSGSTGDSFSFRVGKDSRSAIFSLMWHAWRINGYKPYDRWMNFKGYAFSDGSLMKYSRATNCMGIPCCAVTDEVAEQIYDALLSFRPKHIMGYSSFLYDFCNRFKDDQILRNLGVKQVSTSSEQLFDFQREAIQETFGCQTYNFYHQVEQVCFIYECEKQVKHLAHEYGVLEVVDSFGRTINAGEGAMVCTGFYNRAMPFIRYQMNDLIQVSQDENICSCGRSHQIIKSLDGRKSDTVISYKGNRYNHMDAAFKDKDGLSGMQIIQNELVSLEIKLVRNQFWDDSMLKDLLDDIERYTQGEFELNVSFVTEIERTPNGKRRLVVANLPNNTF